MYGYPLPFALASSPVIARLIVGTEIAGGDSAVPKGVKSRAKKDESQARLREKLEYGGIGK